MHTAELRVKLGISEGTTFYVESLYSSRCLSMNALSFQNKLRMSRGVPYLTVTATDHILPRTL